MKDSRLRLGLLGVVYLCAVLAITGFVWHTMVVEHEAWLQRSYEKRWAFRDVPTKRGAIRDRRGVWLVRDRATSDLEIYYRAFRREHPCAIAVHCANLIGEATRDQGPPARVAGREFDFAPDDVLRAFELCLILPFSYFEKVGTKKERDRAQDLRFYAGALLAALTDSRRSFVAQRIRAAERDGADGTVCDGLQLEPADLRRVFRARLDELRGFAELLRERVDPDKPARPFDLWRALRDLHARWSEEEAEADAEAETETSNRLPMEQVPRILHRSVPYEDAQGFARLREWHPGLRIRPSLVRERTNSEYRWDSLGPFLGAVTAEGGRDGDSLRRELLLDGFRPQLEAMADANEELSDDLRESAFAGLQSALSASLRHRGRVGRSGIEGDQDARLRGSVGMQWVKRGRAAKDLGLWSAFDVSPGADVFSTIDLRLQNLLEHAMDAAVPPGRVAAVVIVHPDTGDVLAMAARPLQKDREPRYHEDGHRIYRAEPLLQWWSTGSIGSVAKPLILAEHLDARRRGRSGADESLFLPCTGVAMIQGDAKYKRYRLTCDHAHGAKALDCEESLGVSCNHFFFQVAEGLELDGIRRAYDRFGLYRARRPLDAAEDVPRPAPSGFFQVHVPGIRAADYPDPTWRQGGFHRRAIGYGIEANVLHIARAYCGLATGRLPELSLVKRRPEELRSVDLGLHVDDLLRVREGMRYCVDEGTADGLDLPDVLAKTGTAEVGSENQFNNAWLAGYVGRERAKLVFTSVVYETQQGGFGAKEAGPVIVKFLADLRSIPELEKEFL